MVLLSVAAPGRLARVMVRPHSQKMEGTLETSGRVERVSYPADGGVVCRGWWITPASTAADRCIVLAHGWTSHGLRMAGFVEPLLGLGYQVLIYNARSHGDSDPFPICTVVQFTEDAAAALRYALSRVERVSVLGHSLGAAATLVAVADGAPVERVVAIAPPSHPVAAMAEMLDRQGVPGQLMVRRVGHHVQRAVGRSFASVAPELRMRDIACPVLLVHGSADEVVGVSHFDRLCQAAGPNVETLLVDGANHDSVKHAPETMARIMGFLGGGASSLPGR